MVGGERAAALGRGDCLVAYDLAMRAVAEDAGDLRARYDAVLALARAGATERAEALLGALGLVGGAPAGVAPDLAEDVGALWARLAKDRAVTASGDARRADSRVAAERYEQIYRALDRPFSGINAATMWFLSGEVARSHALAREVLKLVDTPDQHEQNGYWRLVTGAEAMLLVGDIVGAHDSLVRAADCETTVAARATTRRQLLLVCDATGCDPSVLEPITLPSVVHYSGHLADRLDPADEPRVAAEVRAVLDARDVGFGFGALASGGDLIVAEALLARGAELHVVFPCARDDFVRLSVRPGGAAWVDRFDQCLDAATSVAYATEGGYFGAAELFSYGSAVAMGKALLRASYLHTTAEQIAVWDGAAPNGEAGTAIDVAAWERTGNLTHVVSTIRRPLDAPPSRASEGGRLRLVRSLIFADVQGFSRLTEAQIPAFVEGVLRPLAATIDDFAEAVRFRNTWGDGLYLVLDDICAAARCAVALQETMRTLDCASLGLPPLALRVGAHAGPVFETMDPVTGGPGFFGVEVTRTARVEPGTPPGDVYVTDPFAALVALDGRSGCSCQYVGPVPMAKGYGTYPLYALRRNR